jgi:hypothetical protein
MRNLLDLLGKPSVNVAALERIYGGFGNAPGFVASAISAMRQLDAEVAWRATALLRRCAQDGRLSESDLAEIAASADEVTQWIARLNLCQVFAITGCPESIREQVFPFLVNCYEDRRVIIRAWAISSLVTFQSDPAYAKEISVLVRRAGFDPQKSMQARLRQLKLRAFSF